MNDKNYILKYEQMTLLKSTNGDIAINVYNQNGKLTSKANRRTKSDWTVYDESGILIGRSNAFTTKSI